MPHFELEKDNEAGIKILKDIGAFEELLQQPLGKTRGTIDQTGMFHLTYYIDNEIAGAVMFKFMTEQTVDIHPCLAHSLRGLRLYFTMQAALEEWFLTHININTIFCSIPEKLKKTLHVTRKLGYTMCGRIPKAITWGGVVQDLILFSKKIK